MKNINELIKEYTTEEILARAEDYTHSPNLYICDTISEIADSDIDVYYGNLLDWVKNDRESVEYIEESVEEFGQPERFDFYKLIQQGQYLKNERELYNNLEEFGKIWLLAYLRDVEKIEELTKEQAEKIDSLNVDNNMRFEDLIEQFKNED